MAGPSPPRAQCGSAQEPGDFISQPLDRPIAAAHVQPLSPDPVKDSVTNPLVARRGLNDLADPDARAPTFAHLETWLSLLAHVEQLKTAVAYVS